MTTFSQVDIRLMLNRLRPGAAYHWKGDADSGYATLADAVGEWRDKDTALPKDTELLAEWEDYLAEQATGALAEFNKMEALETAKQTAESVVIDDKLTIEERLAALEKLTRWLAEEIKQLKGY